MRKNKLIYAILLFSFAVKLISIGSPIFGFYAWRQSDTASIAKNFYETGNSIIYPQIEWRGTTEGYVESEFHLFPYIVSKFYSVFGFHELWGRLISIIFSLIAIYYLYLLVRRIINEKTALWAAFVYSILPINLFFSRAFMPESTMLMFSVCGLYYFYLWTTESKMKDYFLALIFISLAVLVKLPTLYLGIPLFFLLYNRSGLRFLADIRVWCFVIVVLLFGSLWYYHAHNLYQMTGLTFSIWSYGTDKWGTYALLIDPNFYNSIFIKSVAERELTYAGFLFCIFGLFVKRKSRSEYLFDWWLISVIFFFLFVSQGNVAQEYYQLPICLPAAVFIGKFLDKYLNFAMMRSKPVWNKIGFYFAVIGLIALVGLSGFRYTNLIGKETIEENFAELMKQVKMNSGENDLVVSVSEGNPLYLYNADRKGWKVGYGEFNEKTIDSLRSQGAQLLYGEQHWLSKTDADKNFLNKYQPVFVNDKIFVYRLR